ncbi:MAG TPA: outer membrane beta-barrel protein [Puia sp.]|jgi:outer membrane receptor protein involved in Fe transport|nr:outer membrane beta-barrel protein [Puia sp.]
MKNFLSLIFAICLNYISFAQIPMVGGQGRPGGGQVPSIGHFYGKIVDAKTNKGIDGVSVQLITSKFDTVTKKMKETPISGMITKKGDFSMENLPIFGNFRLRVTAIGYKPYDQKVAFDLKMPKGGMQNAQAADMQQALSGVDKDLGNIKLEADIQTLAEVTVSASKPLIQLGVDRKIYNVEKDISAQGGSGLDVMKNIPSVSVDIDGNVTLRNSTPIIFVDGLPTTLTLDQIPADAIESVEIITNPGAKFDASGGMSGILNIVLKKNRKAGYNGNVRAGIDERGKFNLGGDLNVKQGKVNVFGSINFNQRKSITSPAHTTRSSFLSAPFTNLYEDDYNVSKGYFEFGRFGLDYFLDNRNTISASGTIVHGSFSPYINSDLFVDTLNSAGTSSYTRRLSNTTAIFNNLNGMLSYKHNFPKAGEDFTANANYSKGTNSNNNFITSTIWDKMGGTQLGTYNQQQIGSGTNENITAQADFTNPISDKSKFETGARISARNITSLSDLGFVENGVFNKLPLSSSNYSYQDRVYAAYGTYSNTIKDFGFQLGLRAESSNYNGLSNFAVKDNSDTVGNFSNKYPISLFPSVFLSQKLGNNNEFTLNYTRRIDRPSFFQLFPFTDYSDSSNISRGNPALKPQFTNSFELAYQLTLPKNNTLIASVYYKYTTDLITRTSLGDVNPNNGDSILVQSFINARSAYVGGFELISRNSITKWWDVTSNVNIFMSKINVIDTGVVNKAIDSIGRTYAWFAKINNTFKITKKLTLQITADYTAKTVLPPGGSAGTSSNTGGRGFGSTVSGNAQGYNKPTGGVDASIKYEFLKNKAASFTLSCGDIFRTRVSDVYTTSPGQFNQEVYRQRDPQFFRLQFNYRFGKFDATLFKRKNLKGEMDNMQNNMQSVQQ